MATKPAFATGAQFEHAKFGLGSVILCNEEHISVKWDDHGEKKFVLAIILPNLKKSDRQPPAEKRRAARTPRKKVELAEGAVAPPPKAKKAPKAKAKA
jgi:hypothetical protein